MPPHRLRSGTHSNNSIPQSFLHNSKRPAISRALVFTRGVAELEKSIYKPEFMGRPSSACLTEDGWTAEYCLVSKNAAPETIVSGAAFTASGFYDLPGAPDQQQGHDSVDGPGVLTVYRGKSREPKVAQIRLPVPAHRAITRAKATMWPGWKP